MKLNSKAAILFAFTFPFFSCSDSKTKSEAETETEVVEEASEAVDESGEYTIPGDARVFFANLNSGDAITSPVYIEFGIEGMEVEPAGELNPGKGHHHLIIGGGPIPEGTVVPADSVNIHFGKGQTNTEIELSPGTHTLTMQFADGYHQSYGEQLSETIEIQVVESK